MKREIAVTSGLESPVTARRIGRALIPAALLLAAIVVLGSLAFAISNLERGEETLPNFPAIAPAQGANVSSGSGQILQTIGQVVIGFLFLVALAGVIYTKIKGEKLGELFSVWELAGYALGFLIFAALVFLWPMLTGGIRMTQGNETTPILPGGSETLTPVPTSTAFPIAFVVFIAILAGIVLFAYGSKLLPRMAGRQTEEESDLARRRSIVATTVRQAIAELEEGREYRDAVISCYRRMSSILADKGLSQQDTLTPREVERLALFRLGLSEKGMDDLTGLFEEARYSTHPIGPEQRDRAVECLEGIRRELEG